MLISLTQGCYESLKTIREEMKEQKRLNGQPEKTTFSEIVCMFIKKYQQPMTNDGGSSPHFPLLISSRDDTK
jgi:hypothetical protein